VSLPLAKRELEKVAGGFLCDFKGIAHDEHLFVVEGPGNHTRNALTLSSIV
jgi:hypothetical protein